MIFWLIKTALYVAVIAFIVNYWLSSKQYLVNYNDIETITRKHLGAGGRNPQIVFRNIEQDLRKMYGEQLLPSYDTQWIFVNCGGWMGHMYLLHASMSEYILFFGTEIDTSGHSGRYWANISDTIISGSYRQWKEGELTTQMYKPGDTVMHGIGEAAAVQWSAGTYMVEYGRGFIPSTLFFALADTVFGTTDIYTFYYTVRIYAKCLLNQFKADYLNYLSF